MAAAAASAWDEVLDRFEATLTGYGDRLAALDGPGDGEPVLPAFVPPTDLGPIPRDLEPRARRLVFLAARLEVQVRADLDAVGAELRARAPQAGFRSNASPEPELLDRTA